MIEYVASSDCQVGKNQLTGVWFTNKAKAQPNDVHVCLECDSITLGHNTQDLNACGGTPLAISFEKDSVRLQYKSSETNVSNVPVDPVVFAKHFLEFLTRVRDETLAKPFTPPKKAVELKE